MSSGEAVRAEHTVGAHDLQPAASTAGSEARHSRWRSAGQVAAELGVRVALMAAVLSWFPPIFYNDVRHYWRHARLLSPGYLPYRDFLWEFPPVSLVAVVVAPLFASHLPAFRWVFGLSMVASEYASLQVLRRHRPDARKAIGRYWHAVGLPLATIAWFRLDFLAVLFATVALVRLLAHRSPVGPIVLGVGAKLWPGVLAVLLLVRGRYRLLAGAAGGALALGAGWFAFSPEGLFDFLRYREGSGFQVESTVGALRLIEGQRPRVASGAWVVDAGRFRWADDALFGLWLAIVAGVVALAWRRRVDAVALAGGLVAALLLCSRLLSPQFLVWLLPFLALGWADGERRAARTFAVAAVLTVVVMLRYDQLLAGNAALQAALLGRNLALAAISVFLLLRGLRPPRSILAQGQPQGMLVHLGQPPA